MADKFELTDGEPAAPGGKANVKWQSDSNGNISAYVEPGASQTPWAQNVDAAGFGLTNAGSITTTKNMRYAAGEVGAGSWYSGNTQPDRAFVGMEQASDKLWRIYSVPYPGNLFTIDLNLGTAGIRASDPAYPLDVNGIVNSRTGGFRFPDGTTQVTADKGQTPWAQNVDAAGHSLNNAWGVAAASPEASLLASAVTVREAQFAGAGTGDITQAPTISFLWAGRFIKYLTVDPDDSAIRTRDHGTTDYTPFTAARIESKSGGFKFPDGTVQTTAATTGTGTGTATTTTIWEWYPTAGGSGAQGAGGWNVPSTSQAPLTGVGSNPRYGTITYSDAATQMSHLMTRVPENWDGVTAPVMRVYSFGGVNAAAGRQYRILAGVAVIATGADPLAPSFTDTTVLIPAAADAATRENAPTQFALPIISGMVPGVTLLIRVTRDPAHVDDTAGAVWNLRGAGIKWTLTAWSANASMNAQTGTSYTLVADDNGKIITMSNAAAITLTVPAGLGAGFSCLIVQLGAGKITVTASGVTVVQRQSFTKTAGQYAVASLLAYAANVFALSGDLGT